MDIIIKNEKEKEQWNTERMKEGETVENWGKLLKQVREETQKRERRN
jgi:hypothetical protein